MARRVTGPCVLVVDDEPLARRRAIRVLRQTQEFGDIHEAGDVASARRLLETVTIDVMLLDIQIPGGTGFDVLDAIKGHAPAVVFVTAFDEWALRAFEANAIDYVTKPIDPGRLRAALSRALDAVQARSDRDRIAELTETLHSLRRNGPAKTRPVAEFWLKSRGGYVRVPASGISRFQADGDYVRIYAGSESYMHQESLTSLMGRLGDDEFIRVHRSAIVRKDAIVRIRQGAFSALVAVLNDGVEVRVGRTYAPAVRATLIRPS